MAACGRIEGPWTVERDSDGVPWKLVYRGDTKLVVGAPDGGVVESIVRRLNEHDAAHAALDAYGLHGGPSSPAGDDKTLEACKSHAFPSGLTRKLPPLGVQPPGIWVWNRLVELVGAIGRYTDRIPSAAEEPRRLRLLDQWLGEAQIHVDTLRKARAGAGAPAQGEVKP